MHKVGVPEKPRISLIARTCVNSININGTSIYLGLDLYVGGKMFSLSDCEWVSMVSRVLLHQVNQ